MIDADDLALQARRSATKTRVTPASTATRRVTDGGSTLLLVCLVLGIEGVGARHGHQAHFSALGDSAVRTASAAMPTSEPVAITIASGAPARIDQHVAAAPDGRDLRGVARLMHARPGA